MCLDQGLAALSQGARSVLGNRSLDWEQLLERAAWCLGEECCVCTIISWDGLQDPLGVERGN